MQILKVISNKFKSRIGLTLRKYRVYSEEALNRIGLKSCVEVGKLENSRRQFRREERNSSSYIYFTNYSNGCGKQFEYTWS